MSTKLDSVSDALARFVDDGSIEGATVRVTRAGEVVVDVTAGDYDGAMIRPDSLWWVASLTKPIVALATLVLADEGAIDLDDPVRRWIPEFSADRRVRILAPGTSLQLAPPVATEDPNSWTFTHAERELTVRDFLTMTSGLQTIMVPNAEVPAVGDDDDLASFTSRLGTAALDFQPGSRWHYSNATGYEVPARIIELAAGQPFAEVVSDRLFAPLGMSSTSFGVPERLRSRALPLGPMAGHPLAGDRFASGSAGLFTTVADYSRFAQLLLDRGTIDGRQLVSPGVVAAMTSNQIGPLRLGGVTAMEYGGLPETTNDGVGYGFGVLTLLDPALAGIDLPRDSSGWDGIGSRRFWVVPELDATIVMFATGRDTSAFHRSVESAVRVGLQPST